jgi:hypothetical protein
MTAAYVQTYDNLVADVINYMERDDAQFVAQIPTLIGLAESAIAAELKTLLQLIVVETTLLAAQDILEKPTRWRKTISMKINGKPVLLRSQDYVAQYQSESDTGQPKYYAEYDYNNWAIAPVPDAVVEVFTPEDVDPEALFPFLEDFTPEALFPFLEAFELFLVAAPVLVIEELLFLSLENQLPIFILYIYIKNII